MSDEKPSSERDERERREPLGGLTEEIDRRRKRKGDGLDDAFENVSVESVDTDAVWEQLSREDADPTADVSVDEPTIGTDAGNGSGLDRDTLGDRDVRVVEKRSFCQRCRYFSDPPDVACSHEGAEILELVDAEHFRVVDCPMVDEAERLNESLGSDETAIE